VFDPERDEDTSPHRFYLRLLIVFVISAAGCLALWPSVSGFSAGPDHDAGCLAITDGWQAQRSAPDMTSIVYPTPPPPEQLHDPVAIARWRTKWLATQARPEVRAVNDFLAWKDGPGACVAEGRHRLLVSAIGLATVALIAGSVALTLRTRSNLRRASATAEA
jgi:hypothetical protein